MSWRAARAGTPSNRRAIRSAGRDVPGEDYEGQIGSLRQTEALQRLTGLKERTAVIHEGLRAVIARESARRLAQLGGSERTLAPVPRRRQQSA